MTLKVSFSPRPVSPAELAAQIALRLPKRALTIIPGPVRLAAIPETERAAEGEPKPTQHNAWHLEPFYISFATLLY